MTACGLKLRRVGIGRTDNLDDTDNTGRTGIGMIKKRLIADLHLPHEIARLLIAHTVPRLSLRGTALQIIQRKIAGLGFHQPVIHECVVLSVLKKRRIIARGG